MPKQRLDVYLTENGYAETREKAKAYIMSGIIFVNDQKEDKAGTMIKEDDVVEMRGKQMPYVSRGGYKLEKAVDSFSIDLTGCVCMDVGASTGGFTDCMLQNGAVKVYSVDVGYGQLAWKLRCDERVVNLERTNARYLTHENVPDEIDFTSVDVSFISLKLVLPVIKELLSENGHVICLIKPQFEAGREKVGKKGVVRDPAVHEEVVEAIYTFCNDNGLGVKGLDFSPIKGPEGNIEYLIYIEKNGETTVLESEIKAVVKNAHDELDK